MKAPSAIDRPATAAITPDPTAISRVAAMKNSGLSVPAASRNSGFNTSAADDGDHTQPRSPPRPRATTTPCTTEPSECFRPAR